MTWLAVVTLLGALQGVILFFAIIGLKRGNRQANRIAAMFILCLALTLCGRWAYTVTPPTLFLIKVLFVGDLVIFFFGPLLYLYFLKVFDHTPKIRILPWVHFIPLIVFSLAILPFIMMDRENFLAWSRDLEGLFTLLEALAIAQNFLYLAVNVILIRSFQASSYQTRSIVPQVGFYRILLGMTFVGLLFWAASFGFRLLDADGVHDYLGYQLVWIGLSIMVMSLGYYVLRFPEVFDNAGSDLMRERKAIKIENIEELTSRLESLMRDRKPFLEPRLTLKDVADLSEMSPHAVSRVVNEGFGKNFFEFVNSYRIEEFKRIATPERLRDVTVLSLALEAGFNSKSTFNTAFKRLTGQTPSEYHRSLPPRAL